MNSRRADLARMMPDAFPIFFAGRQPYHGQTAVMPEVVRGHNVLFASPTASGKTEAAVAPLYQRHLSFGRRHLSTVYVAPTKALVNDIYERLVDYLGTRQPGIVARYTGDRHELRYTYGVFCVVVTPEAADSLQLRHPDALAHVRSVVVDEIHLLHGQARGQQLRHVIARIKQAATPPTSARDGFHVVGMTATLDDMRNVANVWLGEEAKVLSHGAPRDIDLVFIDVNARGNADHAGARALAEWLDQSGVEKALVFANSRNGAHTLAAHLHRELSGTRWPVYLHFGVLGATERERVEQAMRTGRYGLCVATTTLEIGIDIGDLDAVVLSEPPGSVSGFLQRIGRGNRRSDVCRAVAFRRSADDERLIRALTDCGRRGDIDDVYEYDRPSVRFQQVLSLSWAATRQDRPLTVNTLCAEAGTDDHTPVVHDMIATGCLQDVRGALVPCNRLMDEGDAGRIHTVIAGHPGSAAIDIRTGLVAIRDTDESNSRDAVFHGGSMRSLATGADGGIYLGVEATLSEPLARIKATAPALPMSRSVIWGLARQQGFDPTRWRLDRTKLVTWGGETFNRLAAALFTRAAPGSRFLATPETVTGPMNAIDISVDATRKLAREAERAGDLPVKVAAQFAGTSRFVGELSPSLAAEEKRRAIPWGPFYRWLDLVTGVDISGAMPPH